MALNRRDLLSAGALGLAGSTLSGCISNPSLAPPQSASTLLASIDPELRPIAKSFLDKYESGERSRVSAATLMEKRGDMSWLETIQPSQSPGYDVKLIPGVANGPDVPIHIVYDDAQGPKPAIIYMHGGGYVSGHSKGLIKRFNSLVKDLGCVVIAPEYRLAPETTFEGSVNDNYSALLWAYKNAGQLGIDRNRIAVMGGSAGGGHSALLALAARDRGEVPLSFQCLIYPMLDDRTGTNFSPNLGRGGIVWSEAENNFGWTSFLGVPAGGKNVPIAGVPARRTDLKGLPPTFIGTGSVDLFAEENIAYAKALIKAGVETELYVSPGGFHAFDNIAANTRLGQTFNSAKRDALKRAFTT